VADPHENANEILRLRGRLHEVESKLVGIEMLLNDLREWRAEVRHFLEEIRDEERERKVRLTLAQKMVGLVLTGLVAADALKGLLG
jgi:hypothetical protein